MNLFAKLKNFISPQAVTLTVGQEMEIRELMARAKTASAALENQYVTREKEQDLQTLWADCVQKIDTYHVPMQHPLSVEIDVFRSLYKGLQDSIEMQNQQCLAKECADCQTLFSNIDGKQLDTQQQSVVVCDENRNLVVAGAGSGKTLTIAAKVKYLCEVKKIRPEDILLIAFTKKSAEEMTERIAGKLSIPVDASTFHKLGLGIITQATGKRLEVLDQLSDFVRQYFEKDIMQNPQAIQDLMEYFAYYLKMPANLEKCSSLGEAYEKEKAEDLETLKSKYQKRKYVEAREESRQSEVRTLKNERVKSLEEVMIANFLFLHGVAYEYERPYPFAGGDLTRKAYRPDFYLPEYDIYIEHFGINRTGRLPWLSPIEEKKYQEEMQWKRQLHRKNGTTLRETYSYYVQEGRLQEKLDELLQKEGVHYKKVDFAEVFQTTYLSKSEKYVSEFMKLCCTFITLFKSNGFQRQQLKDYITSHSGLLQSLFFSNVRTCKFMKIMDPLLEAYEKYLTEQQAVDFSDMINQAAEFVAGGCDIQPYKWIIIDEFQDISMARYRLVQSILARTGAKLLCVGDDWQSIYRFAGSDLALFTNFEKYFGPAAIMRLEKTYRNSQQLIDQAGAFVMRNPQQLRKNLRSAKSLDYPIAFMSYHGEAIPTLERTLRKIIHDNGPEASILLLGRTNYDMEMLTESNLFTINRMGKCVYRKSPQTPIRFLSIHKAKGLEADNVVLLNFKNTTLGFPNQVMDDPVLDFVLTEPEAYPYAEERRLLYVALTRTRNRVFVLVDAEHPSEFLEEFSSSKSVFMQKEKQQEKKVVLCPLCKTGHLVRKKTANGYKDFVGCSNYPRCQFKVQDLSVLWEPRYCPKCGGLMVRRKGKRGWFYGCSNYPLCEYTEQQKSET